MHRSGNKTGNVSHFFKRKSQSVFYLGYILNILCKMQIFNGLLNFNVILLLFVSFFYIKTVH